MNDSTYHRIVALLKWRATKDRFMVVDYMEQGSDRWLECEKALETAAREYILVLGGKYL